MGLTHAEFAHVLAAFPLVPEATRAAALAAYDRLVETGEADALNPDRAADREASEAKTATVRGSSEEDALRALISGGESATCEFKSTARFDLQKNERADYLTDVIVKAVAGFANAAEGGTLLIGVDDAGTVLGLDADLSTLGKKSDLDGYELWLTTELLIALGRDAAAHVSLSFPVLDAKPVCRVDVSPSPVPRFGPDKKQAAEVFYLRTGNQT